MKDLEFAQPFEEKIYLPLKIGKTSKPTFVKERVG
jgi:hypothetical protein